jgi:hypothetical protein
MFLHLEICDYPFATSRPVLELAGQLPAGGINIITARTACNGHNAGPVQNLEEPVNS